MSTAQQFNQALTAAQGSSDTLVLIRLREGTYDAFAASVPFAYAAQTPNQVLDISGGWSGDGAACTTQRPRPALTQLVGIASSPTLTLGAASNGGQVYVHDLAISNPNHTATDTVGGACLFVAVDAGSEARLERLQVHDCVARNTSFASGFFNNRGGTLIVRDVAVANGLGRRNGGIGVTTSLGGTSSLAQISVARAMAFDGNPNDNAGILLNTSDAASRIALSNSVSWGNSGYLNNAGASVDVSDVAVSSFYGTVDLTRVHRGSLRGTADSDNAPGSGDPGFVAAGDPRPRADSILVDSGIANPAGGSGVFDADGATRVQGVGVDVGAFEYVPSDTIFRNGFDVPPSPDSFPSADL
ncbi:hypothetical protein [Tahibacter caeni]|uniref:hypothetical protein n=1 Tax=Tahibacter caeni TaxID=1453545 RepID=UPI0021497E0C|nr:hypothetical protein [Tahibacter caeni]